MASATAINNDGYSQRPQLVIGFRYVDSSRWFGFPEGVLGEMINHPASGYWRLDDQFIHARRVFSSVDLRYSPDAHQSVRVTFQQECLE